MSASESNALKTPSAVTNPSEVSDEPALLGPETGVNEAAEREKPTPREIFLKADTVTLPATADKEGRIRLNHGNFDAPKVIQKHEELVMRWEHGQVVVFRRPRAGD